ncbi:MAG TPA: ATP-binding cassette domain-containing protein [Solirubrobacteraceae bacterium]|jgi:putative ABC transport system ATP-binding protein|nr:ATP-binding cassette domain-containing protein [Solirubrobacteraceae bacterium]
MLRLERISKRRSRPGERELALDEISFELDRGQIMGIFGPSGAGKTTLLRIAAGLHRPDSGTVTYNGRRLEEMSAAERTRFRRREIACVWALQPWQERLDVFDHVALPLLVDGCGRREVEWRVHEALLACEADQCTDLKLDELSTGERQRVELARALITEPRLLLADGPTSNLSLIEREGIMELLSALAREARVAVLVTASDAQTLVGAQPVHYLRDGKLIDSEPIDTRGKVYPFPGARSHRAAADA